VISVSFICVLGENSVILLDIKIGLPFTLLLREIIYEIDPGKGNERCYLYVCASNEVDRQNGHSSRQLTLTWANLSQQDLHDIWNRPFLILGFKALENNQIRHQAQGIRNSCLAPNHLTPNQKSISPPTRSPKLQVVCFSFRQTIWHYLWKWILDRPHGRIENSSLSLWLQHNSCVVDCFCFFIIIFRLLFDLLDLTA